MTALKQAKLGSSPSETTCKESSPMLLIVQIVVPVFVFPNVILLVLAILEEVIQVILCALPLPPFIFIGAIIIVVTGLVVVAVPVLAIAIQFIAANLITKPSPELPFILLSKGQLFVDFFIFKIRRKLIFVIVDLL